jgi:cytidylate kinase
MASLSDIYRYLAVQCRVENRVGKGVQGFVTISRQSGSAGIAVGEKLGLYLNEHLPGECPWTVFNKNLVDEIIKDHNLSSSVIPFLEEKAVPEIEEMLEELLGVHPPQSILVRDTNDTIIRLAKMGHVIIVGHGAAVITNKIPGGVHVRLVGSLKKRKDSTKENLKCNDKGAEDVIYKEDEGRRGYLKQIFGKDIDDPLLYDLVINTDLVSLTQAASLIGGLVVQKVNPL